MGSKKSSFIKVLLVAILVTCLLAAANAKSSIVKRKWGIREREENEQNVQNQVYRIYKRNLLPRQESTQRSSGTTTNKSQTSTNTSQTSTKTAQSTNSSTNQTSSTTTKSSTPPLVNPNVTFSQNLPSTFFLNGGVNTEFQAITTCAMLIVIVAFLQLV